MYKFALCNEIFQDRKWSEVCEIIASIGYQGVEIAPFTLCSDVRSVSALQRASIRNTASKAGLEVAGLHWLLVSPPGLSLTTSDMSISAETSAYLCALVDFCADLSGSVLVLGSPKQRRISPGETSVQATERLTSIIMPALQRCEKHGLTLCLEPLPPPEADLILTMQEAVEVINSIQHPNLKTILDVKSASSEFFSIPDLIERYAPYIAHFHANDANRQGPGFGNSDFIPFMEALEKVSFDGYVSVEVFDIDPDPMTVATESLAYLRKCVRQRPMNTA